MVRKATTGEGVPIGNLPVRSTLFDLHARAEQSVLDAEESIVWLHDPHDYPYLRETVWDLKGRSAKPAGYKTLTIVGYGTVKRDAPDNSGQVARPGAYFKRRVWYVRPDADPYAEHGHLGWPVEAVWPASIGVGILSEGPTDADHRRAHQGADHATPPPGAQAVRAIRTEAEALAGGARPTALRLYREIVGRRERGAGRPDDATILEDLRLILRLSGGLPHPGA